MNNRESLAPIGLAFDREQLFTALNNNFNLEELRTLGFQLGADLENLPGETKDAKARELILLMQRHGRIADLLQKIHQDRPHLALAMLSLDAPDLIPLTNVPERQNVLPAGSRFPLAVNPLFVGRQDALQELALHYQQGVQTVALTGLGGVGKTQLAVEFAYRYGRFFPGGVFWLNFAQPDASIGEVAACGGLEGMNLLDNFSQIAPQEQVQLVQRAWRSATPRLLIFDNCEDPTLLSRWRPPSGGCRVLITSRRAEWDPALSVSLIPLGDLGRGASVSLLHHFVPNLPEATAIARALNDFPLALHLAGNFLRAYQDVMTSAAYLAQLRNQNRVRFVSARLPGNNSSPTGHDLHLANTFSLSYEQLDARQPTDACARRMLISASCFPPGERIPRSWLAQTAVTDAADIESLLTAGDGLHRLLNLGLIASADAGYLRLHPLLADYVHAFTPDDEYTRVQRQLRQMLLRQLTATAVVPDQRQAARWLMDLGGVADLPTTATTFLAYLEQLSRFIDRPSQRTQLIEEIDIWLAKTDGSAFEKVQLLVYLGTLWGYQTPYNPDAAHMVNKTFQQAHERINRLISDHGLKAEYLSLLVRIKANLASLHLLRAESLSGETQRDQLQQALLLYEEANALAQPHMADWQQTLPVLIEAGYSLALLRQWIAAEERYLQAFAILEKQRQNTDKEMYARWFARVSETASLTQWLQGQMLAQENHPDESQMAYLRAISQTERAIEVLQEAIPYPTKDLGLAFYNLGDYFLAANDTANACKYWRLMLAVEEELQAFDFSAVVQEQLREHCL